MWDFQCQFGKKNMKNTPCHFSSPDVGEFNVGQERMFPFYNIIHRNTINHFTSIHLRTLRIQFPLKATLRSQTFNGPLTPLWNVDSFYMETHLPIHLPSLDFVALTISNHVDVSCLHWTWVQHIHTLSHYPRNKVNTTTDNRTHVALLQIEAKLFMYNI